MSVPDSVPVSGRWRALLFGAFTLLVSLAAAELILRRTHPVGGHIYRLDADLLFDAQPGARTLQRMPEDTLKAGDSARHIVSVNGRGFRGDELAEPKERPRILVLGDSYVMAENVPLESTFVVRLGVALAAALGGPAVETLETINGGRSGYGPDQSLLLLERECAALQPDLVVWVLSAHNDLGDLGRNKLFRTGDGGALVRERPTLGARVREQFAARDQRAGGPVLARLVSRALAAPERRARADDAVGEAWIAHYLEALGAQAEEHFEERNSEVVSLFEDIYDADVAVDPGGAAALAKAELLTAIVRRARAVAGDVPVRFVIVPSAVDVCDGFGLRVDAKRHPAYRPDALANTIGRAVEAGGGTALNLFDAFHRPGAGTTPDRFFVGGLDPHWNVAGQALAARATAAWLAADAAAMAQMRR